MTHQIRQDLSQKLQVALSEVLDRETRIAAHVLSASDIGLLMLEASVMMARTTAATLAGHAEDEAGMARTYGVMTDAIIEAIDGSREDGIARTIATVKARAA